MGAVRTLAPITPGRFRARWRTLGPVNPRSSSKALTHAPPNRIRELREARGLTLDQLAGRLGTTNQQISHLELGKRQLTVSWLRRLGEALEVHPWAIVESLPDADD